MSGHACRLVATIILWGTLAACGRAAPTVVVPAETATEAAVVDTATPDVPTDVPTDVATDPPTDVSTDVPTDSPTAAPADTATAGATDCPAPIIASFTAQPDAITAGDSAMLNWGKVDNARSAVIDNRIGGVRTPGSKAVRPGTTTTYVLTASGCGGVSTAQVTISVYPPLPTPNPGVPQGNEDYQPVLSFSWGQGGELLPNTMYGIEIQIKRKGQNSFHAFIEDRDLQDTTYENTNKPFPNDIRQLRFRVWQINKDNPAQHSARSDWSIITLIHS